jgi:hypothetical protein
MQKVVFETSRIIKSGQQNASNQPINMKCLYLMNEADETSFFGSMQQIYLKKIALIMCYSLVRSTLHSEEYKEDKS